MALSRFPTYLRLVGTPREERRTEETARIVSIPAWNRDLATGVASRQALMDRLTTVGELAPKAPLSFVAVRIVDAEELDAGELIQLQKSVAARLRELTRATDLVGRVDDNAFGVVLQGTGATAAGAVASRLSFHLNRVSELPRTAAVIVSAATGTGANAETLAVAALDNFEVCAG